MKKIDCAVIAAAGMGTRLKFGIPKSLVNISENKKIIDYQLEMLENVNDIRVVVGYKAKELSNYIDENYDGIEIIHNENYKTNSICYSLHLATEDLDEPYIAMCGDVLINKLEFNSFLNSFNNEPLLGVTRAKTDNSIFVSINEDKVFSFQQNSFTNYEWANIACICEHIKINKYGSSLFNQLKKYLPLKYFLFDDCYEVDTCNDLRLILNNIDNLVD